MQKNGLRNSIAKPPVHQPAHQPSNVYSKSIQDNIVYLKNPHSCKVLECFHNDDCRDEGKEKYLKVLQPGKNPPQKSEWNKHNNIPQNNHHDILPAEAILNKFYGRKHRF